MRLSTLFSIFKKSKDENIRSSELTESDANEERAFVDRGIAKAKSKDYRGAIQDFSEAIKIEPTSAEAYLERSKVKRRIKDEEGANEDLKSAKLMLDKLDAGLKAYDDAGAKYESGDYKNAIKRYDKAISSLPSLTNIYYDRGIAKQLLGDYEGALEDFDMSIEVDASNKSEAYYQRGKIKYHKLDDADGALQDYNKAIELKPTDPDLYYSRAMLLDEYGALQDLNKAIQLDPSDARIYFARALKKHAMEDIEGCIRDLDTFIDIAPSDSDVSVSEACSLVGSMKMVLNDFEAALEYQNMAVELEPFQAKTFLERGITKELLTDYEGAILDFNKTIELDPSNGEAYHRRGLAKAELGRNDEGRSDMTRATELGYEDEYDEGATTAACQAAIDSMVEEVEEVEEENRLHGAPSMEEIEEERQDIVRDLKEALRKATETE